MQRRGMLFNPSRSIVVVGADVLSTTGEVMQDFVVMLTSN
jgi:hypothetical protein